MQYREFLDLCKNKDIVDMVSFMLTPAIDLSTKIVVSAIFQQYPSEISDMFGLDYWEGKLSNEPVVPLLNLIAEKVDLVDFAKAVKIATSGLNEDQPGLDEQKIADMIRRYVYDHIDDLAGYLNYEDDAEVLSFISDAFALDNKKREIVSEFETELKNAILISAEEIALQYLLGYQPGELSLEKNLGLGLNLQFNTNPSGKVLKEYAEMLKSMGLDAGYFTFPTRNGKTSVIEISNDTYELADKLPLLDKATPSQNGFFGQAKAHLLRANELREKSVSDVELANSSFGQASNTAKRMGR